MVQTPELISEGFLVDLAIKDRIFVIWLDNLCKPGTQDNALFQQITRSLAVIEKELPLGPIKKLSGPFVRLAAA